MMCGRTGLNKLFSLLITMVFVKQPLAMPVLRFCLTEQCAFQAWKQTWSTQLIWIYKRQFISLSFLEGNFYAHYIMSYLCTSAFVIKGTPI